MPGGGGFLEEVGMHHDKHHNGFDRHGGDVLDWRFDLLMVIVMLGILGLFCLLESMGVHLT